MNSWALLGVGFLAQGLFSARFLIQLVKSEKAGKVLSPVIFWQLSLAASFLLLVYGTFRQDVVIVGGQLVGYFIYIRNLKIKNAWQLFPKWLRWSFILLPLVFLGYLVLHAQYDFRSLVHNPEISGMLLTWGTLGQVIFTTRFVVQWLDSERSKESQFPVSFWYISLVGAVLIASYAILRKDSVLFIGQAFGILVYVRNLMIHFGTGNAEKLSFLDRIKSMRMGLLLVFTAMVLFFNLGAYSVTESSEARYAQIAKEMVETGDWLHPQLMGIYHYHKPPMTYWLTAISYKVMGISPFSARFLLQISVLFQIWLVYKIALIFFRRSNPAFLSAMLYASFPALIISSRALTTDSFLALFVLVALYFWFTFSEKRIGYKLILCYAFLGIGFLTKGPVVLIVPLLIWIYQGLVMKQKMGSYKLHLAGIALMLGIGLSWFVFLQTEDDRFLNYFLFKHTIDRFATDTFHRGQPFWFYGAVMLVTAFPWVIILLKKIPIKRADFTKQGALLVMWVLLPLLFFSLSQSKLVLYILPLYSGLAIGAIYYWEKLSDTQQKIWERWQLGFHLLLLVALVSVPLIEPKVTLNYKFYFIWFVVISLLLALQKVDIRKADRAVISAFIFTMGLTGMSTYFMSQNPGLTNDTRRVTEWITQNEPATKEVIIYNKRLPSVLFNSDLDMISVFDGDESLNRETQFQQNEKWKAGLINLQSDSTWIIEKAPNHSIWISKKKLPYLNGIGSWEELQLVDGWRIVQFHRED
ncbi:lipid-A-disaccharide synthase N-terminal domain-containing protein [Algoriphagus antarcticus]|uniref:4-amino-4-deoxy-L-arabinose transferase-like glycosyltransferase n=1 Tax=Algoriphagus antarcticus TaxID=238540 RepID=A0A3E0DZX1_9BACT|nr:lipid-A-disaccharide synthase N-terminal domain-containing protein [Algoriphagus antarcticus]REG91548.1 4-amino-4-deoxy-L-arabinose transferase-like glycosyltransferase [Algoriphagus antarcticus]